MRRGPLAPFARLLRDGGVFFFASLVSLVLVIAVNAAVFALLNQMLLSPLPYRDIDALRVARPSIRIGSDTYESAFSREEFRALSARRDLFDRIAGFELSEATVALDGVQQKRPALHTDDRLAQALGLRLSHGSFAGFSPRDARPVAVISDRFWRSAFGAREDIVGRELRVDGQALRIAGVLDPRMRAPVPGAGNDPDLWLPAHLLPADHDGSIDLLFVPAAGLGDEPVRTAIDTLLRASRRDQAPIEHAGVEVLPLRRTLTAWAERSLWIMQGIGLLVFLVAAGNIASVFLLRCEERSREITLHTLQGARLHQVFWLVAVELVGVCAVSAVVGLLLAALLLPWLQRHAFEALPAGAIGIDWRSAAVVLLVTLAGGLSIAAIQVARFVRHDGLAALASGRSTTGSRTLSRTQGVFISAQAGLSILVVVLTAMLGLHLRAQAGTDPGYRRDVHAMRLEPTGAEGLTDPPVEAILAGLRGRAGVGAVGVANTVPLSGLVAKLIVESPAAPGRTLPVNVVYADAGYFAALGLQAREGRLFDAQDVRAHRPVAVVNTALARRLSPEGRALRQAVRESGSEDAPRREIVGIVPEVASIDPFSPEGPTLYLPFEAGAVPRAFVLASGGDAVEPAMRAAVASAGAPVAIAETTTLAAGFDRVLRPLYGYTYALGAGATVALLLSMVGLIGAVSSVIAKRQRELALRLLLGARARDLLATTLARIVVPCLSGAVAAVIAAYAMGRVIRSRIHGFEAPAQWFSIAVALATLGLLATLAAVPVLRMMRRDRTV